MHESNTITRISSLQPSDYILNHWVLVPIEPGTKGPTSKGWNTPPKCIDTLEKLKQYEGYSFGLGHAYSGTCAIDIDDWERTVAMLWVDGIDLKALCNRPDAVLIIGRDTRAKLLYALPEGILPLRTKSISTKDPASGESIMVVEFRCATAGGMTVQDVLPPSIHPGTGKPYRWAGAGDPLNPPVLPPELLDLWQGLVAQPERSSRERTGDVDETELRSALFSIDPDGLDYDSWLELMMAVNASGEEWAGDLFMYWSAGSGKDVPRVTAYKWRSLDPDGDIGPATLFKRARDGGWSWQPEKNPKAMFGDAPVDPGSDEQIEEPPEHPVARYMYLRDLDKFIDTHDNVLMKSEQLNRMFPMNKTTWVREFFSGEKVFGRDAAKGLTYLPNGPRVSEGHYNIWQPSDVKSVEGDVSVWLDLMERLLPNPDERHHLLQWMGYTVQHPAEKINHAILIVSEVHGVGKDTLIEPLMRTLGVNNCEMIFAKSLSGQYNAFLQNAKLMIVQEIMDWKKGEIEHYFKPMLASPPTYLEVNEKFEKRFRIPNICQFILFSNELNAIKVAGHDRRYYCLLSNATALSKDQGGMIWDWYKRKQGFEKVAHYLRTLDLTGFDPSGAPPMTHYKTELIDDSRNEVELVVEEYLAAHPEFQVFTLRMLQARVGDKWSIKALGNTCHKLGLIKDRTQTLRFWVRPGTSEEVLESFKKGENDG